MKIAGHLLMFNDEFFSYSKTVLLYLSKIFISYPSSKFLFYFLTMLSLIQLNICSCYIFNFFSISREQSLISSYIKHFCSNCFIKSHHLSGKV